MNHSYNSGLVAPKTTITFPTLEAAVSSLTKQVFGVELTIAADPEGIHEIPQVGESVPCAFANALTLEAEAERLHALYVEAAIDAQDQRREVGRFVGQRDAYYKDVFAYAEFTRSIAAALGWSTHEISFKEVLQEVKDLKAYESCWKTAGITIKKLTAERNELREWKERVIGVLDKPTQP